MEEQSKPLVFKNKKSYAADKIMPMLLLICAFVSVVTTLGIIVTLFTETFAFFQQVSIIEFFTNTKWSPLIEPKSFGIMALLSGTFLVTIIACLVAIPVGLTSAIYLSEYAPSRVRAIVKHILEVLAGVPVLYTGILH